MEDLSQKINELLSNPDSLEQIKNMASMLSSSGLGGQGSGGPSEPGASSAQSPFGAGGDDFLNPQMLLKVKEAYESMNSHGDDNVSLLLSLRPHMSEKRKDKVDLAIKLIRLYKLKGVFGEFLK